jgi:hypothetical protein
VCPGGKMAAALRPMTSSARYPYSFSAPAFQLMMVPSSVLPMMASCDDSTMAASCAVFTDPVRTAATSSLMARAREATCGGPDSGSGPAAGSAIISLTDALSTAIGRGTAR